MSQVENALIKLRGQEIILDSKVAELYGVETREVNQAVKNNPEKFPDGYVLTLDSDELADLRSKFFDCKSVAQISCAPEGLHRERVVYARDYS